jgi:hypothetical protein
LLPLWWFSVWKFNFIDVVKVHPSHFILAMWLILIRETQFHMLSRVHMASYIFAQFHPWTMFHACGMFDCWNFTWGLDLNFICFKKKIVDFLTVLFPSDFFVAKIH